MLHATTVPATAQPTWPVWWKSSGMSTFVKAGEMKYCFFAIPTMLDIDQVAAKLSTGDGIQFGQSRLDIVEVYKPGFDFKKTGFPAGSVKPGIIGIFWKAQSDNPYTMQTVAVANILGLRLMDAIAVESAILPQAEKIKVADSPVKQPAVVTPVGEGLPDTINQLTQLALVGGLVVLGILAFKKFAR